MDRSQEQTASSMIFVGIDIAICSATRADKRRAGQEEDKTRPQSPATEFRGAASQCGQGWSARPEDNSRTRGGQDPDTEPGHRAQPQS